MIRTLSLFLLLSACGPAPSALASETPRPAKPVRANQAEAIFASGCFWCSESDFEKLPGVIDAVSGYAGGTTESPTYKKVSSGQTDYTEAIRVIYDPKKVSYEELLDHFWRTVDPFDADGQFCDRGKHYRPAIMPVNPEQRAIAKASFQKMEEVFGRRIALKIEEPRTFWVAEGYHQDYYKKAPFNYYSYRHGCGRDRRVEQIWAEVEARGALPPEP